MHRQVPNKPFLFPIFTTSLSIVLATISSLSLGVTIYGSDDRQDYYEILENPAADQEILEWAPSVPMILKKSEWRLDGDGYYRPVATIKTNADYFHLCPGVRFGNQPSVGYCSGFLVGQNLVASAGHCFVDQKMCDEQLIAFDIAYTEYPKNPLEIIQQIPARNVFECKRLLSHEEKPKNFVSSSAMILAPIRISRITPENIVVQPLRLPPNWQYIGPKPTPIPAEKSRIQNEGTLSSSDSHHFHDLSLVELERPALGRPIFQLNLSGIVQKGQRLGMIGYPSGLPMKFDLNGEVLREEPNLALFDAKIDAFGGNSGSPIIDLTTREVIGVLVSGQADFRYKKISQSKHGRTGSLTNTEPAPTPEPCKKTYRAERELKDDIREYGEHVSRFSPLFIETLKKQTESPMPTEEPTP